MTTLAPGFIDACEREALHHIGAIQPDSALLGGHTGDPRKSTPFDTQSHRLSPRSSFATWLESKTGCAEPRSDRVLSSAKKIRSLLLRQMSAELRHD